MKSNQEPVYSKHVVEFVAVANEFCKYAEHSPEINGREMILIMQRLLPLLYLKAAFLPQLEPFFEDGNEKFVTESDWSRIHDGFRKIMGSANDYLGLSEQLTPDSEMQQAMSIAEDLADIYQDLKNFLLLYQTGTPEVMNDSVWECRMNFETYWGTRLLNSTMAIHKFIASGNEISEQGEEEHKAQDDNHSNWFISRRQKEFREGDE
jgi:hypothetical protein